MPRRALLNVDQLVRQAGVKPCTHTHARARGKAGKIPVNHDDFVSLCRRACGLDLQKYPKC